MEASTAPQTIEVGTVLAETYEITRLLGQGGMGAVWEAKHLRLQDKRVAIKVLLAEVAKDAESVIRFRREANIASQLGHSNIVQVFDIKELADGSQYIVLEFLEGSELADRMSAGPMHIEQALPIIRQVASALQAAHGKGIVHRDLKPGNVMLVPAEIGGYATEIAKVLDFGISKMQDSSTLKTQTSTVLGTPQYMAPEQALGEHKKVDARTDIFALGSIVYEMLSGTIAFSGTTIPEIMFKLVYQEPTPLRELAPYVPQHIADAVHKAMAKDQNDRFLDMSAFIEALTGDPLTTLRGAQASGALASPMPASLVANSPSAPGFHHSSVIPTRDRTHSDEAFATTMGPATTNDASVPMTPYPHPQPPMQTAAPVSARNRRSAVPYIALAIVTLIAAIAITVIVMQRSSSDDASAENATTAVTANGENIDPATPNVPDPPDPNGTHPTDPDVGTTVVDPKTPIDKPIGPDKPPTSTDKPTKIVKKPTNSKKLSGEAAQQFRRAKALMKKKKYRAAIQAAKKSANKQPHQRTYALITTAYCARRDLSNARASLRKLKRGGLRTNTIKRCKSDYELDLN